MSGKIDLSKKEVTHKEQNYDTEIYKALYVKTLNLTVEYAFQLEAYI